VTARRALVVAVLAICAVLVSPLPLRGLGLMAAPALAALDVALLAVTGGLAFARSGSLDERQVALRDLAYRRGFRLLGLAIVVAVVAAILGVWVLAARTAGAALSQVDSGLSGRLLIAIAELAVVLPTLVVAWSREGGAEWRPRAALPSGLVAAAVVAGWLALVGWAPAQAAATSRNFFADSSVTGSTCRHFVAGRIVGGGLGATVGMRVEVCWNGRQAFVIGDPGVPLPDGVMADPDNRFLTSCGADNLEDFAAVSRTTCTATTDGDGTLHYAVRARVAPLPFGIGGRDVAMELVVARDGRVLRRP
jgi:hypothetical protein